MRVGVIAGVVLGVVTLSALVVFTVFKQSSSSQARLDQVARPDYVFKELKMVEVSGSQKFWEMQSRHSEIQKGEALLDQPEGVFYRRNERFFVFVAPKASVHMKSRRMQLTDAQGRFIRMTDPWQVHSASIHLNPESESIYARKPLKFWNQKLALSGDEFFLNGNSQISIVSGNTVLIIKEPQSTLHARQTQVDTQTDYVTAQGDVRFQNANLIIDSQQMDYRRDKAAYRFYGQAELNQEDITILADEFKSLQITVNVSASGNVKFTQKDIRVSGQKLFYSQTLHKAYVSGNVQAYQGNRRMVGTAVVVDTQKNRLETQGRSQVIVSRNAQMQ
jgi:lipopolysaccharide export system protein LptA